MNKLLILCLILISVISCNSKKDNNQIQTNGSNEKNQELNQLEKNRHKYKTVSTDGESGILCASNFNDEFSCWADKNLTIWDSQNNNYFDLLEVPANLGNVK